jgi:hypothetical protein
MHQEVIRAYNREWRSKNSSVISCALISLSLTSDNPQKQQFIHKFSRVGANSAVGPPREVNSEQIYRVHTYIYTLELQFISFCGATNV